MSSGPTSGPHSVPMLRPHVLPVLALLVGVSCSGSTRTPDTWIVGTPTTTLEALMAIVPRYWNPLVPPHTGGIYVCPMLKERNFDTRHFGEPVLVWPESSEEVVNGLQVWADQLYAHSDQRSGSLVSQSESLSSSVINHLFYSQALVAADDASMIISTTYVFGSSMDGLEEETFYFRRSADGRWRLMQQKG